MGGSSDFETDSEADESPACPPSPEESRGARPSAQVRGGGNGQAQGPEVLIAAGTAYQSAMLVLFAMGCCIGGLVGFCWAVVQLGTP